MSNGRVTTVVTYQGALADLNNYHYQVPVQLDADGNIIDYYKILDEAGFTIRSGQGWNTDHPYEHFVVKNGVYTTYTTGDNTRGVTEQIYGHCDVSLSNVTSTSAILHIKGKGITYSDTTKNVSDALYKIPLKTAMCAYGRALGLDMTYNDAQKVIDDWPKDKEWKEGILPYLQHCFGSIIDQKCYVFQSKRLVNKLKDWLIDQGAYSDMGGHDVSISSPQTVAYSPLQATALLAYELLLNACTNAGMNLTSASGKRIYDLYQYVRADFTYWQYYSDYKLGTVSLSFGRGGDFDWSTFAHYGFQAVNSDEVNSGNLVYPPETTPHTATINASGKAGRIDWIGFSGLSRHENVTFNGDMVVSEYIQLITTPGEEGGTIVLSNIGTISDHKLPVIPGATLPNKNDSVTTTYPNWHTGGSISMPTGSNVNDINNKDDALPIYIPTTDPALDPISQEDEQEGDNTDNITNILPFIIPMPVDTPDFDFDPDVDLPDVDTPDVDIPDPNIPIIPLIPLFSGSGDGMVNVYNPTRNQVALLTQFLWSNDFLDKIKKIFQDPMEAIISLSVFYATPHIAAETEEIIVGTVPTGVTGCNIVDQQYINIACGTINLNRYFGNVLDYIATSVELYLPFIGYVPIDVASAMGKSIEVHYRIDVLTGDCVAFISVGSQLLYSFNGNCSVKLPISASSYTNQITGAASLIGSLGIGLLTKNIGTAAIGAAASVPSLLNHQVQRGGSLVGNAGAMGQRKPYLIITRQKEYNPTNYNRYYGYPSNETVTLSSCVGSGYTRVKDIRLHDIYTYDGDAKVVATDSELALIESKLKGGIIL